MIRLEQFKNEIEIIKNINNESKLIKHTNEIINFRRIEYIKQYNFIVKFINDIVIEF